MNKETFVELVKAHIGAYKIELEITKTDSIELTKDGSYSVGGYFDEEDGKLVVAGNSPNWFRILVHEYGHFLQWVEGYKGLDTFNKYAVSWDTWLLGERNMCPKRLHTRFLAVRNFELDCEKRAVEMIKKYSLPIDVLKYIQDANAYMYFHAYIKKYRVWPPKRIPDRIKNEMPFVFLKPNEYNKMPKSFEEAITKYCF
jgi:hypothetical protein